MLWLYGVLFAGAFGSMLALVIKEYIKKRKQAKEDAELFV
jgi:predicted outer membrane lipoprotein